MLSQGSFHSITIEGSSFQEHHSLDTETHHLEREPSSLGRRNTDFFFSFASLPTFSLGPAFFFDTLFL